MTPEPRSILVREIADLHALIARLTSMVDHSLERAMEALDIRNIELANEVIARDEEINALRYEIEQASLVILATQQPYAGDLRVVIAAIHLASELERMGDHASGIARLVNRMADEPEIDTLHKLPKMAKRARGMIQESIQAFMESDAERAERLIKRDDKVDKHYQKLFRETLEEMRDDDYIRRATYLLWVGHNLERIGDRATNIAERVIFMVTGQFMENESSLD